MAADNAGSPENSFQSHEILLHALSDSVPMLRALSLAYYAARTNNPLTAMDDDISAALRDAPELLELLSEEQQRREAEAQNHVGELTNSEPEVELAVIGLDAENGTEQADMSQVAFDLDASDWGLHITKPIDGVISFDVDGRSVIEDDYESNIIAAAAMFALSLHQSSGGVLESSLLEMTKLLLGN